MVFIKIAVSIFFVITCSLEEGVKYEVIKIIEEHAGIGTRTVLLVDSGCSHILGAAWVMIGTLVTFQTC